MNTVKTLVNGKPSRQIDVADRGLHYGDGLFETLLVKQGEPQLWEQHMSRLQCGCEALALPMVDPAVLEKEARSICSDADRAVLKIMLTRGTGGRGYKTAEQVSVTRILNLHAYPDYPAESWTRGVHVRICNLRLARQPALAGVKHLNRLEQVLARQEWTQPEIAEGILLDTEDRVVEGVMSNLFIVADGDILTPDLTFCGVAGVMREQVMTVAEDAGICARVATLQEKDLFHADEVFLTNSLIGVWPVTRIEQHVLGIGAITQRIQEACAPHV